MKSIFFVIILFSSSVFASSQQSETLINNLRDQYEARASEWRFHNAHLYESQNYSANAKQRNEMKTQLCQKDLMKSKTYFQARQSVIQQIKALKEKPGRQPASTSNQDSIKLQAALKHYGCI